MIIGIGREVAEKLGLELYDRDLIDRAAEKIVAMPKDVLEKADEKKRNPWLHEVWYDVPNQELNGMTANEALHLAYNSIIRELAEKGDCVFVGRCADYILRDRKDCLHVFICSDMASRARRIVERYGQTPKAPEKRLAEKDQKRKVYYKNYTGRVWGQAQNYDICLNSGALGVDTCTDMIVQLCK